MQLRIRADKSGELPESGRWPVSHVEVDGDVDKVHGFADTWVARALRGGYVRIEGLTATSTEVGEIAYDRDPTVTGTHLVIPLADGELRYRIVEHPGRYLEPDGTHRVTHEYLCELETSKAKG